MMTQLRKIPVSFLIRRSVRYLLVSCGFRLSQAVAILAALSFVLTGSRIAFIDQYGTRADIVASILVTIATIALLTTLNRRGMTAIDRRFFREAYNAELILTELGEAIPTLSKIKQLVELVADKISDALHPETVTIFLDDKDMGAYVAAFSSDASGPSGGLPSRIRGLRLHYDESPIYVNAVHNPPMLVRALLAWQREADEFLRAPLPHRFSSNRAVEVAPRCAVSLP